MRMRKGAILNTIPVFIGAINALYDLMQIIQMFVDASKPKK